MTDQVTVQVADSKLDENTDLSKLSKAQKNQYILEWFPVLLLRVNLIKANNLVATDVEYLRQYYNEIVRSGSTPVAETVAQHVQNRCKQALAAMRLFLKTTA